MNKLSEITGLLFVAGFFGWILYEHIAAGGHDLFVCIVCGGMVVFCLYCISKVLEDKTKD